MTLGAGIGDKYVDARDVARKVREAQGDEEAAGILFHAIWPLAERLNVQVREESSKQDFLDRAAIALQLYREVEFGETENAELAKVAYDWAEALWAERQRRYGGDNHVGHQGRVIEPEEP